ncbi:MAG: hypothetical protein E7L00_02155 [Propionibacteriaceae bacterium]|nr:hypothetical protein [Propionibacteriaceae bacterium]
MQSSSGNVRFAMTMRAFREGRYGWFMKFGMRKPSLKKSIKARTTGRAKRAIKRRINPLYGKKGMGFLKDPERSVKNAAYKRRTFSVWDLFK